MTRRFALVLSLLLATPIMACSDDPDPGTDDTVVADTAEDTTDEADTTQPEDTVEVCENPCLNDNGKNDKSLCPDPKSDWICTEGCCVPVFKCASDTDCAEQGFNEGQCTDDRFDCRCDVPSGECSPWYCGADADCGDGEACASGACIATPTTATTVRITSRPTALTTDESTTLRAELVDPARADRIVAVTPTWSSSDDSVVSVDAAGVAKGGSTGGVATITATEGDSSASIKLVNVVATAGDTITAAVLTELALDPVVGHFAITSADGTVLESGTVAQDGVVRSAIDISGGVGLHVFGESTSWVSWLGIDSNSVMFLPVPKTVYSRVDKTQSGDIDVDATILEDVGIIEGKPDFSDYQRGGVLELSLSSFALSTALFDFSLPVLLGADVKRYLDPDHNIPATDASEAITVPGGLTFGLDGPAIDSFVLTAPEGEQRMWTLAGRLDLTEVAEYSSEIIDAVAGGSLDLTRIVGAVFPLFENFWSAYTPAVNPGTIGDASSVSAASPKLTAPLGLKAAFAVPALPSIGDLGYADALFILGGALTDDGVMLPLGLTGGADTSNQDTNPGDGIADADERTPEIDPYRLSYAPMHSGLNSPHASYTAAIVAVSIPPSSSDPRPDAGSGILIRTEPGETLPAEPTLPDFLAFSTTSTWDPTTRTADVGTVTGSDIQRLLFKGKTGRHWTIWTNGETSVTLPVPADVDQSLVDRASDELELLLVNSLDLEDGLTADRVVTPGGAAIDGLLKHVDRLSFIDIKEPIFPAETP